MVTARMVVPANVEHLVPQIVTLDVRLPVVNLVKVVLAVVILLVLTHVVVVALTLLLLA